MIHAYDEQIEKIEKKAERKVLESPAAVGVLTIPGVGQYTAAVIVAEVGKIDQFDKAPELRWA
nr:transposase [Halobellus sp. DFY28]